MDRPDSYVDKFGDVHEGSDVYSADDQKIGTVSQVHSKYLIAHKGFFFPKDLYIPSDAVDRVENDRVYVSVGKDYVDDQHWDAQPADLQHGAESAQTVRDRIPDAIGTPGTTGRIEEGGREVRAGVAGSRERQIDYGRASGGTADQPTGSFGQSAGTFTGARSGERADLPTTTTERSSDLGAGMDRSRAQDDQTVHLHEEQLRADKERVQTGEVRVGKQVVEEEKTLEVPVTREQVYVERRPGDRRPDDHAFDESNTEEISVPVSQEKVTVEKVPVETEEVHVGTRATQETKQFSDTVRREKATIESTGGTQVAGTAGAASTARWEDAMPSYRTRWQQRYGSSGGRWEDVEPNYQYGWQMANDARYRGRRWEEVEPDLRRDWGARYPDKPWDRAGQAIRDAWDNVTNRS